MIYSVDRFEGNIAVLEDDNRHTIDVARSLLPCEIKVGDCIRLKNGKYEKDADETALRRKRTERLMKQLFE